MSQITLKCATDFFNKLVDIACSEDKINVETFTNLFTNELNRTLTDVQINNIFKGLALSFV